MKSPPDFFSRSIKIYWNLIFEPINQSAQRIMNDQSSRKEIAGALMARLFGQKTKKLPQSQQNPEDQFIFDKLFEPFSEVFNSYESLQNIRVFMNTFPFTKSSVSKVSYLRYHIENYLNEIYIIQIRLRILLKTVDRAYQRSPDYARYHSTTIDMIDSVAKAFKPYVDARGSHIHQSRYNDEDVTRLSSLDLLMKSNDEDFAKRIKVLFRMAYTDMRTKWQAKTLQDVTSIHSIIDNCCEYLLKVLRKNDHLLLPHALRSLSKWGGTSESAAT